MSSVSFLQAGFSEDLAIDYVCDLTGKIIQKNLHDSTSKKIFIRCNDAEQAIKLDERMWGYPKHLFIPHKISTEKNSKDCEVSISYPGIKNIEEFYYLVNLNPQLPSNYSEYKETLQIVIKDNSTNQEIARESYKKCLGDGIKPKYVEENEESF